MDEFVTSHPEADCGKCHQDAGDPECPVRSIPFQDPRNEKVGNDRACVDGKIEDVENARKKVLVFFPELIADVGRDAWFDPSGAKGNHSQSCKQPALNHTSNPHEGQGKVTETVNDGESDDGPIFPKKGISNQGSE